METTNMIVNGRNKDLVADPVPFARSYQLEALEKALKQNTLVFFETGTGKTLIAIMLLRSYAHILRNPSSYIAVFLVPTVILVPQQAEAVEMHTDLKVGKYYGEMGVDFWDADTWKHETEKYEVLVMTPQILLDALRKAFVRLNQIKVLVFDECHKARGKDQYACIMTEFYHRELASNSGELPRVFGMTASPIKAKASGSPEGYWKQINKLENLMNSKVFTCDSDSVLTQYVPISTPKVKIYDHVDIPHRTLKCLEDNLTNLIGQHELSLNREGSAKKRLNKALSTFLFCLTELGVWLAMKAAEVYSREEGDVCIWSENREMGVSGHRVVRAFSLDAAKVFSASMPSGPHWSIRSDLIANVRAGYISSKVMCLVQTLLEYREVKDLRCIIFVQRIVTAIVISDLLNELLPELSGWRTKYTAGSTYRMQSSQSRKEQTTIVDEFRKGTVNIIVSTSMLEEGLDVQSCNLVIRFDPSVTVCSFIQSRGRARMQNSDFILMVKSGDDSSLSCVKKYLSCGDTMRRECLSHVDIPCLPISEQMYGEKWYQVGSTGAIVTLNSSVQLLSFYCSKLPSDGYFKPSPRFTIDEVLKTCTLQLPNSCPIQTITVQADDTKSLKQLACLEACEKLHQVGALTDHLVPDVVEEAQVQKKGKEPYLVECATYFPPELIGCENQSEVCYYCYLIELKPDFQYDIKVQDIVLAVQTKLDDDLEKLDLDLDLDRGKLTVNIKHIAYVTLNPDQVALCQRFQISLFRVLIDHNLNKLENELDLYSQRDGSAVFNYLLLPSVGSHPHRSIDWKCINAVVYQKRAFAHTDSCSSRGSAHYMHTKNGLVCRCVLENSLVCTPHNDVMYCLSGILDGYDGNTFLELRDGEPVTYTKYYERRHGIKLQFERETLLKAKRIFTVHNYLHRCRKPSTKESSNYSTCELPPELCLIIMSPISVSTIFSFSFLPSIMHRIESLLLAANLKRTHTDHCTQNEFIPTLKVLEAITTKKCQENFHLESLETLGDSFLKYVVSQQLFKTYQNRHEGFLSIKKENIISNASLCKLGCDHKIMGFIRNEPFNPKTWIIPGSKCANRILEEEILSSKKVYIGSTMNIKSKRVADVVEALIGAFLSAGGETAALFFMKWLGIDVDFLNVPYTRNFAVKPELHINIKYLESLLKYKFKDASLLVEALTHGSYMLPEIPGCYQRLEFLGDAVLDYLITVHLSLKYPGLSPGLLTDLRSASVNNDCYAQSAIKAQLNKHILHISPELQRQINHSVCNFDQLSLESTFGWESSTAFPKVLGDVIESIAGAIFVDSGYDKEIVFQSMRPLLEPLITPETLRLHPVRELTELCQKEHYTLKPPLVSRQNGLAYVTVEVEANGVVYKETCSEADKKMAKKLACRAVLKSLKDRMPTG